jgi:hypothetical protein
MFVLVHIYLFIYLLFFILEVVQKKQLALKAQYLSDVTQYAYAECQVTKFIHNLVMDLVRFKCEILKGNNSAITASIMD